MGNLSRQEVIDHFARAKGFVFPGVEDFGITPLESLASGTPVIAYRIGGVLETLNDEVAHFFDECDESALEQAILDFEKKSFNKKALYQRAEEFSKAHFKKNILEVIEKNLN